MLLNYSTLYEHSLKQMFVYMCVQASTFQMAILLQYNHGDSFSVQLLQENTQIDMVSLYYVVSRVVFLCMSVTLRQQY